MAAFGEFVPVSESLPNARIGAAFRRLDGTSAFGSDCAKTRFAKFRRGRFSGNCTCEGIALLQTVRVAPQLAKHAFKFGAC